MSLFSKSEGYEAVVYGRLLVAGQGLEILYQTAVTGASHDAEQCFPPPNCYPGTQIQIPEILKKWINNDNRSTLIYWIYSAAGIGKSAVATILETFAQGTATGHLAGNNIDLAIHQKRNIVHAALEHQFQELIVKPCSRLRSEKWKSLLRLIVIDGLDECLDIASPEHLLSIIQQSKTSMPP
ncbi:hypothetical protein F5876DRAFT_87064 [Lentinula aff. lateritia]|uniref:Uncharacterized protein n=1 Tax=Lentinula aff. lateritia TaxID=2804960 RepID=A0ACC1U919_9AGAR|nr:hypothetical protein F5876DRAFT_87064 [Lentinula aff. lateritia]